MPSTASRSQHCPDRGGRHRERLALAIATWELKDEVHPRPPGGRDLDAPMLFGLVADERGPELHPPHGHGIEHVVPEGIRIRSKACAGDPDLRVGNRAPRGISHDPAHGARGNRQCRTCAARQHPEEPS